MWVNPFALILGDDDATHPDILLSRLCAFQGLPETSVKRIVSLHEKIRKLAPEPPIVPHDNGDISAKIVTPLQGAKISFVLGHFIATVALCGVACEMLAVFPLEHLDLRIRKRRLHQDSRIRLLHEHGIIDDDSRKALDTVRQLRNKYVHLNFDNNEHAEVDARTAYLNSISLLDRLISATFTHGKMQMNPVLLAHLRNQGVVESEDS